MGSRRRGRGRDVGYSAGTDAAARGILTVSGTQVVLTFRLSGRAPEDTRGEGLALWLAADGFRRGAAFGAAEKFVGAGVLFDTRVDEVRLVVSDALATDPAEREAAISTSRCGARVRYDASRDDYSHRNVTRARLVATPTKLRVLIDERGENRWRLYSRRAAISSMNRAAAAGAARIYQRRRGCGATAGAARIYQRTRGCGAAAAAAWIYQRR